MLRSVISVFSYVVVIWFFIGLVFHTVAMITGAEPLSFMRLGAFFDDKGLSLLVGLIGIYVTRKP